MCLFAGERDEYQRMDRPLGTTGQFPRQFEHSAYARSVVIRTVVHLAEVAGRELVRVSAPQVVIVGPITIQPAPASLPGISPMTFCYLPLKPHDLGADLSLDKRINRKGVIGKVLIHCLTQIVKSVADVSQ